MMSRSRLLEEVLSSAQSGDMTHGLELMADYAGAMNYLLARWDVFSEDNLDFAVASNWPFDLVRELGSFLVRAQVKSPEIVRCGSVMKPAMVVCPTGIQLPDRYSPRVCIIPIDIGPARLLLLLCFENGMIISQGRLVDVAQISAYHISHFSDRLFKIRKRHSLTERELECLSWIAEGKTSDEISLIVGISRNTVNNYITGIMNKTASDTRAAAVAFAVRNSLI